MMATVQKSIRLPKEAVKEIEALASVTGRDFSGIARDLLIEAVKIRMNVYVMAIANAVQGGEKIAKEYDTSPADKKIEKIIGFGFH